jgi:hypothetical protein
MEAGQEHVSLKAGPRGQNVTLKAPGKKFGVVGAKRSTTK